MFYGVYGISTKSAPKFDDKLWENFTGNRSAIRGPLRKFSPVRAEKFNSFTGSVQYWTILLHSTVQSSTVFLGTNLTEVDFFPLFWPLVLNRERGSWPQQSKIQVSSALSWRAERRGKEVNIVYIVSYYHTVWCVIWLEYNMVILRYVIKELFI